ncbi:inositol monophosphatase family protein [Phaeobacter sp.]|uniref:inositol monophosphatase family protein n=1 Tax=Phaeobacter sp. TaxID=1902409 RepID=UPI0025F2AC7B|nr:inositol monophosphatase family protein [Phaeobacter sp.]
MTDTYSTRLGFAKFLAQEAGFLAQKLYREREADFVSTKGLQDFVTQADRAVEAHIRSLLLRHFPSDAMLGEEDGLMGDSSSIWVVDPIDGTANYMRGLPDWAISIAFCWEGEPEVGVIFAPERNEMCWAVKGQGAFCNDQPIQVSACAAPDQALLLLGRSARGSLSAYLDLVRSVIDSEMEYRRNGSAAVSLMDVAQGRAEGYYEAHLNPWDALAGVIIIREAGGIVRCAKGAEMLTAGSPVLALARNLDGKVLQTLAVE